MKEMEVAAKDMQKAAKEMDETALMFQTDIPLTMQQMEAAAMCAPRLLSACLPAATHALLLAVHTLHRLTLPR